MASEGPDGVSSLTAPSREKTSKFTSKWSLPSSAKSGDAAYDSITVHWRGSVSTRKVTNNKVAWSKETSKSIADHDRGRTATSDSLTIDRKKFYPLTSTALKSIDVAVEAKNNCGSNQSGWKSMKFKPPKTPTIEIDYDDSQGLVTIDISCPTTDVQDRYRCSYEVYRTNKGFSSSQYPAGKKVIAIDRDNKQLKGDKDGKAAFTLYHNVAHAFLSDGESIIIQVKATAKGFAGDSATKTKTLVITSPMKPQITKIELSNKATLNLVNNLAKKQFVNGSVKVYYKSAEGAPTADDDQDHPDVYSLERAITPYKVNTVMKADVYPDWTTGIDTNAGSTSESTKQYQLTRTRYTDFQSTGKKKIQYYRAYDKKKSAYTSEFGPWKADAYKSAKMSNGKKRYTLSKTRKGKAKVFKAYDKKTKKWVKNIKAWEYTSYKKKKFVNGKKKTVARYKNFTRTGSILVMHYKAKDEKTGKVKTGIPPWKLSSLKKVTYKAKKSHKTAYNPADAVMGEPIADVLDAMGFDEKGGVYDKRVWYRIRVERFGITEYSQAFEATEFAAPAPTAKNDYAGFMRIMQVTGKRAGTAITGTVGWNNADKSDEGVDNPNWRDAKWTTLVKWSEFKNAFESNGSLDELEIDWKNSASTHKVRLRDYNKAVKKGKFSDRRKGQTVTTPTKWKSSADFTIYGLEPGVPIYLWTQRRMVLGEYDLLGPRSSAPVSPKGYFPFTPIDNPTQVLCYYPENYIYGEDLTVSWSHNATCEQKSWTIYVIPAENMLRYKPGITNVSSIPKKLLMSGTGKKSSEVIPKSKLKNIMGNKACIYKKGKAFTISKKLCIVVGVSTGGEEILSIQDSKGKYVDTEPMTIIHKPTCGVFALKTFVDSTSRKVLVFTGSKGVRGTVSFYAINGGVKYYPDGEVNQALGECVWSTSVPSTDFRKTSAFFNQDRPLWKTANLDPLIKRYPFVAVVTVPPYVTDLFHDSKYRIEAFTTNILAPQYHSDIATRIITCEYAHEAPMPGKNSRIVSQYNEKAMSYLNGFRPDGTSTIKSLEEAMVPGPSVQIYCAKPDVNYASTDRCNVYRCTPDGADLIAEMVPFETVITDKYAPFSKFADTRYILMTVTSAGRFVTREIRYSIKRHGMRFDWGTGKNESSIELPFDIQLNPSYEKDARITSYVNGTVSAHFNKGITKTESVSTKLVKLQNPYQFELVRKLGQHPGTAFFRAHDGSAYECVVKVSGLSNSFDSQVVPVSLELTRVTTSDRFKPGQGDIEMVSYPYGG